ncbi:MAG: fibrinogen-like YCDxxxxGGGW domain-containing protein, partial [Myxococcota bacterium]|nr:fibrinogen-like YCDxxxxGGGW domain-containing protein [Myxococcota bacterium]
SACAIIATAAPVLGAVPLKVPLQGVIRDNAGVPVVEDVFSVTFSLYETADSEEAVWSESWPPAGQGCEDAPEGCVHVVEGRFQVDLGTHVPLEIGLLAGGTGLWLGMAVETDPELPRRPLGSAPYALHAQAAASASALDCSGCVALDMLGPGVVGDIVGEALEAVEDAGFAKHEGLVISEDNLPADGLSEVSNGLLTNEFTHLFSSAAPVAILDHSPAGVSDVIQVADVGTVQALRVSVDLSNSDLSSVTVYLHDPNAETVTLFAKDGPGEHLVATYPIPDAPVAGDLGAWVGQNPQGAWTLEVVDDGYLNNAQDGQINAWSIQVDTLSAQEVAATGDVSVLGTLSVAHGASVAGDLEVGGTITGPGGIVVGASEAPCDGDHAGAIRFDPESQRLTFCTGTELLQLKACSTDCPPPENTTCGLPVKNGCDGPCEGTGTALDPVQCLSKVSTTPCGETVLDGCDNSCNQTGTGLNVAACPLLDSVACGDPVLDACGNNCGETGTGFEPAQCPAPSTVDCGLPTSDLCGNDCSVPGGHCPGLGVCVDGGCQKLGGSPDNPAITCLQILESGASTGDGLYWLDPDAEGPIAPQQFFCDMTTEGGGWIRIDYSQDLPFVVHFQDQGDGPKWLPQDLSIAMAPQLVEALHEVTSEGRQTYVGLCEGVISYAEGGGYIHAFGFRMYDGSETPNGQQSYAPFDVTVTQDGCQSNGGENGALNQATIFEIRDEHVPIINVHTMDNGGSNEAFGSPLTDNPAWLR